MPQTVAFVAYETPLAPCGGIAAVLGRLPTYLRNASGGPAVVLAPFHYRLEKLSHLEPSMKKLGEVGVPLGASMVMVDLLETAQDVPHIYLRARDPRFFAGRRHPYDIPGPDLARDSIFFGAAVARALRVLAPTDTWSLALQDWETATVALALTGEPRKHPCYLTLHNSYDCEVEDADLEEMSIDSRLVQGGRSILERALPLVERPVFTVSSQFAIDMLEDHLQRVNMAPHLQKPLAGRLIGVDNGPFIDCAVPADVMHEANTGRFDGLREWKQSKQADAIAALKALRPSEERPVWGDLRRFKYDGAPWFVMAGRDDSRQKGYDVAAGAVERVLSRRLDARFLFFPIPGDEGLPGLTFLRILAEKFPEQVLVLPFRFREGYFAILQGAAFGIMPSLYEPFGMANEFYLNGTLGIGRATGGIVQQIVPWRAAAANGPAVEARAARWHTTTAFPTGILFREPDGLPSTTTDWHAVNTAKYDAKGGVPTRVVERMQYPTYRGMVNELTAALQDGVRLHTTQRPLYERMLAEGVSFIQRGFSWERAAQGYLRFMNG